MRKVEKEVEIKVLGIDVESIRKRLHELEAPLISREKQTNILINSSRMNLSEASYLRIRSSDDILHGQKSDVLTLKKRMANESARENIEISVQIDNVENMLSIFQEMGWDEHIRAGKYRESYRIMDCRVDIDEWDSEIYPYPYIEIEYSDPKKLRELVEILEINESQISTKSIKELMDEI